MFYRLKAGLQIRIENSLYCEKLRKRSEFASQKNLKCSLRFRFAINTTNSHNCEFAELRKIAKANSYLIRKFWPSYEKIFQTGKIFRFFRFIAKNCEAKWVRFASQKKIWCSLRFRFAFFFEKNFAFAIDFWSKFGSLIGENKSESSTWAVRFGKM